VARLRGVSAGNLGPPSTERTNHDQARRFKARSGTSPVTTFAYLKGLNAQQRDAVVHGVGGNGANIAAPLLVIAGAGSGKTNTLAHRVAHLIVNGADPGRILLLTFSRRASAEMERRAERIVQAALGASAARARIGWLGLQDIVLAYLVPNCAALTPTGAPPP
jgi:hypothetical protein